MLKRTPQFSPSKFYRTTSDWKMTTSGHHYPVSCFQVYMRLSRLGRFQPQSSPLFTVVPETRRMLYQNFIAVAMLLSAVLWVPADAHPGEVEPTLTARQLKHRQSAIKARHAVARKCDGAIAAFEARRRARRSALGNKKHHGPTSNDCSESATKTSTANVPTYTTLQNVRFPRPFLSSILTYCLSDHLCTDSRDRLWPLLYRSYTYRAFLSYESADEIYTQHEELLRTDIRDGMDGIPLLLDVGVMDVTTCTPIENALVDVCELYGDYLLCQHSILIPPRAL